MLKQYIPWIITTIISLILFGVLLKSCNQIPDNTPYELKLNELKQELQAEKIKAKTLAEDVKKWELLYIEEKKKPKKIIKITNEKVDSIKHLPINDALKYHSEWTRMAVPRIPE